MKTKILIVPFVALMISMGASAAQPALDIVDSIYELETLFVEQQYQFLPISPPAEAVYVHTSETVLPVDWATFPKEFTSQMYAEMDMNGFPLYRVSVYEDPITRQTIFVNSYGTTIYKLEAEDGYDPYAWQKVQFDLEAGQVLSELWQWIYDPAHIAAEFLLIPEVFHADYLATQEAQTLQSIAMAPMIMMMLSSTESNLLMAINHTTNGTVELEIGWPSNFTDHLEIFVSTNLVTRNWELIPSNITTSGSTNYFWEDSASTNHSQRFYITGNADLDSDTDSLTDARELLLYSTEPEEEDTDGDGVWDGSEVYDDGSHGDHDGFITDPLVQDTGYLLPDFLYTSPTTNLSGFSPFDPPTTNMTPNANTPAISEWTRTAGPGDTIALAAMGTPTNYIAYAPGLLHTSGTTNWFSGGHGAVTLPSTLPVDEMILLWPVNTNGAGPAIALNKTEVWWNQTQASTGEVFSIFGRNLGTNCHVWVEQEDEWLDSVSCNPYKADFLVPTNYNNGSYTLWAHNGSGHKYGFADSLTLDVVVKIPWDEDTNNWYDVTDYGALGNGTTDDWPAIEAAIDDADDTPWSTVYFPTGHYRIGSQLNFRNTDQIRVVGEDMDLVVIQPHDNYTNIPSSTWKPYIIQTRLTDFELKKVTLRSYGVYGRTLIRTERNSRNVILDEVVLDQTPAEISYSSYQLSGNRTANFVTSTNITLRNSMFLQKVNIFAETRCSQIFVENCTFVGMHDAAHLFGISGSEQVSIVNSTAENLDDTAAETNTNAWSQGRWVHCNGGFQNIYFGENETVNMTVREGYTENQNTGEHFMFELMQTHDHGVVASAISNTVTFNASLPVFNFVGMVAVVQEGEGQGQNRIVTGMTTNMITVDEPWLVEPAVGSTILMGTYSRRIAVYGNHFDGRPRALGPVFMGCAGIESFGGCVDLVAEGNHFTEMRFPINVQSENKEGISGLITQPNFFNLFMNNTGSNCYHALAMYVDKTNGVPYHTPQLLGNVYRNNVFDTVTNSPVLYHGSFTGGVVEQIDMQVFDKNSFTNYTAPLILYDKIEETNVINQVMINP